MSTSALDQLLTPFDIPASSVFRDILATATEPVTHIPLIVVQGAEEGPSALVTAGVHGAEYASIEAANRLADIDPSSLKGRLVVLPVVTQPSYAARSIYVNPIDGKNLNREFPGKKDGSFAEQLAYWLSETFIRHVDIFIDLHGGDLNEALIPFVIYAKGDTASEQLAHLFGLPNVITSASPGHSYSVGKDFGVPAILAEAGGQGLFPEKDIEILVTGVKRVLQSKGMLAGEPEPTETRSFAEFVWLRSQHDGFWYLESSVGDELSRGQRVGFIKDFRGQVVHEAFSPTDGKLLFAVASLAINSGDPLVGIGT